MQFFKGTLQPGTGLLFLAGSARRDFLWATVAVALSVLLQWLGMAAGIVTLTAPFVLAVWAVKGVRYILTRRQTAR